MATKISIEQLEGYHKQWKETLQNLLNLQKKGAALFDENNKSTLPKMIWQYVFTICFLCVYGIAVAAVPSAPAVPGKARIVIKSEPLGGAGVTADVEINSQKVASVGVEDTYSGVFSPGKIVVTVKGVEAGCP